MIKDIPVRKRLFALFMWASVWVALASIGVMLIPKDSTVAFMFYGVAIQVVAAMSGRWAL